MTLNDLIGTLTDLRTAKPGLGEAEVFDTNGSLVIAAHEGDAEVGDDFKVFIEAEF